MKSKGLGDSIEKITKATGLKTLTEISMELIGKKRCGCEKRKKLLNNWFPYNNT